MAESMRVVSRGNQGVTGRPGADILCLMRVTARSTSAAPVRTALFSDVDGTLLDSRGRLAITAADAAAVGRHADLILASSRTLAELALIEQRLQLDAALIAENGALVSLPARWRGATWTRRRVIVIGSPVSSIRPRVRRCAEQARVVISDQNDIHADRAAALRRTHSMCLVDIRGKAGDRLMDALRAGGLSAARSGTWITITEHADKGVAAHLILALAARNGAAYGRTIAIGNAANDAPLLAVASSRLAVRVPRHGHDPALLNLEGVRAVQGSLSRAWRELVREITTGRGQ